MDITLGALEPKLKTQLSSAKIKPDDLNHLQLDADAITRCHLRGLLGDAETTKARKRLMRKIAIAILKGGE